MSAWRRPTLAGTWLLAGCGRLPGDDDRPASLGAEVLREVGTLGAVLSARWVVYAVVVVTIALLLRRLFDLGIRIVWRLGWDPERAMARGQSALDFTFTAVAALLVLRPFFNAAPVLAGSFAVGIALVAAVALPAWIQDLVAGIELATRRTLREGDQVAVKEHAGTVRSIGLLRTRLREGDGSTLTIPNRLLASAAVRVGRDAGAVPITIKLPTERADDPAYRRQLEQHALLSAFRRSGSSPILKETPQGWTLTLQTWATRDAAVASRALEQIVRDFDHAGNTSPAEVSAQEGEHD